MADELSDFDSAHFRAVLGHFPTGVTIVTGLADGQPIGFTVGSFMSISLDPPLVGFLAMHDSETWMAMAQTSGFCVNVLCNTQAALCWRFARRGNEGTRFDGLVWQPAPVDGEPGHRRCHRLDRLRHRANASCSATISWSSAPCGPSITTPKHTSRSCSTRVRSAGSRPTAEPSIAFPGHAGRTWPLPRWRSVARTGAGDSQPPGPIRAPVRYRAGSRQV